MPGQKKQTTVKAGKATPKPRVNKPTLNKVERPKAGGSELSGRLADDVKRLEREVVAIKALLHKRPSMGEDGGARRDHDKALADRLARLDEKIETLWGRVSDLEEQLEGEGGRTRETDLDEMPDRDFFER